MSPTKDVSPLVCWAGRSPGYPYFAVGWSWVRAPFPGLVRLPLPQGRPSRAFSGEPGRSLSPLPQEASGDSVLFVRRPQLCSEAFQILTSKSGEPQQEKLAMCLATRSPVSHSSSQGPPALLFLGVEHGFSASTSCRTGECPSQGRRVQRRPPPARCLWGSCAFAIPF